MRLLLFPLFGSLASVLTLAVVVDLFEKLDTFLDHDVPFTLITRYYAATIPFLLVLVLPITMLVAVLFCLGGMARRNELVAITAAGISLYRVVLPVFLVALVVSAVGLVFTTEIVPRGQTTANEIYDHEIKERPRISGSSRRDLSYLGADGRFFLIRRFDGKKGRMDDVVVQQFSGGTLVHRLDAEYAEWTGDRWEFHNGFLREFGSHGPPHVEPFTQRAFAEIVERPEDFLRTVKESDEMTFRELSEHITRTAASGGDITRLLVDRHARYSFPLASFIVALLGAPLTGAIRRGGHAVGFGIALLVGFLYYILLQTGETFGYNGTLPPLLAAWLPNLVFLVIGCTALWKTRK